MISLGRRLFSKKVSILSALILAPLLAAASVVALPGQVQPANAAIASDFNPENIISDAVFFDGNAMTAGQVQSFLNAKVPICTINNGDPTHATGYAIHGSTIASTCLKSYSQPTSNRSGRNGANQVVCSDYVGASSETAASIITRVGQACGISQKVLLVLLEKEQSLVTDNWPNNRQFDAATGFDCYDNNQPCVSTSGGFFNQVWAAAKQFKNYGVHPSFMYYPVGQVSPIHYQAPNTEAALGINCGTKSVRIQNRATAALYYYTPYAPNTAALKNLYGKGDDCSAYGNRNFWRLFTDWFGSTKSQTPTNPMNPLGTVTAVKSGPGAAQIQGWTFDPETASPITLHVYLGGTYESGGLWGGSYTANVYNEYVGRAYPSYGFAHGFDVTFRSLAAPTQACIYAINVGSGGNTLIDCPIIAPATGTPMGNFEGAWLSGLTASLQGWSIDPDSSDSVRIHAYVGGPYGIGRWGGEYLASVPRGDLNAAYPLYTGAHGFSARIPVGVGTTPICLYAMDNQISGASSFLGCKSVSTASGPPIGNLESISGSPGSVRASGWVLDPDSTSPVELHVYVDGRWGGSFSANATRPDVGQAYSGYGENHGFQINIQQGLTAGGTNNVCIYGINIERGYNSLISCKSVRVPGGMPFGNLESVSVLGASASVTGWVIDPDSPNPVALHAYVNGQWAGAYLANLSRADVGVAFPNYGDLHGFALQIPLPTGQSQLCLYAINTGAGITNPLLGCRQVFK